MFQADCLEVIDLAAMAWKGHAFNLTADRKPAIGSLGTDEERETRQHPIFGSDLSALRSEVTDFQWAWPVPPKPSRECSEFRHHTPQEQDPCWGNERCHEQDFRRSSTADRGDGLRRF